MSTVGLGSVGLGSVGIAGPARAENSCRKVLNERITACADDCVARAKAAVDPEIRSRIKGYGCVSNCAKLEMFNGHACPR